MSPSRSPQGAPQTRRNIDLLRCATVVLGRVCKGFEPDQDSCDVEHGEVIDGTLFVAGRKTAELLQAVEQALHPIARSVGRTVKPRPTPLALLGRDHRSNAASAQMRPCRLARKRLVAHHPPR